MGDNRKEGLTATAIFENAMEAMGDPPSEDKARMTLDDYFSSDRSSSDVDALYDGLKKSAEKGDSLSGQEVTEVQKALKSGAGIDPAVVTAINNFLQKLKSQTLGRMTAVEQRGLMAARKGREFYKAPLLKGTPTPSFIAGYNARIDAAIQAQRKAGSRAVSEALTATGPAITPAKKATT